MNRTKGRFKTTENEPKNTFLREKRKQKSPRNKRDLQNAGLLSQWIRFNSFISESGISFTSSNGHVCRKKLARSQFLVQSAILQSYQGIEGVQAKGKTAEERQQQEHKFDCLSN